MRKRFKGLAWLLVLILIATTLTPAFADGPTKSFPTNEKWNTFGVAPTVLLWGGPANGMPYWYTKAIEKGDMNQKVIEYYKKWRDDFYKVYTTVDDKNIGMIEGPITGNLKEDTGIWKDAKCISASEHTGYGMIVFALMAGYDGDNGETKTKFDSLVRMYLGLKRGNNLMAWAIPEDRDIFKNALKTANIGDLPGSATDGDFDIAYALLLADKQWPNDKTHGKTYLELAKDMINNGIFKDLIFEDTKRIALGDWHTLGVKKGWADGSNEKDLLIFNKYVTRSSDFMLENLRAFAKVADSDKQSLFNGAISECYKIFEAFNDSHNDGTGLISDFIINGYTITNDPNIEEGEEKKYSITFDSTVNPAPEAVYKALDENFPTDAYTENSCRVPQRLALDYIHTKNDKTATQLRLLSAFINGKIGGTFGPVWDKCRDGYLLNGNLMDWDDTLHLGTHTGLDALQFSSCLVSSNVVSASITLGEGFYHIVGSYADPSIVNDAYFKDTLALMNLLMISGNWWSPIADSSSTPPQPEWLVGTQYTQGDLVVYGGKVWQCKYTHKAESPTWYPGATGLWFWSELK